MKAFNRIAQGLDISLAIKEVEDNAHLFGEFNARKESPNSPHSEMDDIWVRYGDIREMVKDGDYSKIAAEHKSIWLKNMPEIMSVLFRPIAEKNGAAYVIEAYDGNINIRAEQMKKMSAEQVQAALFFFSSLGKELLKTLPLCLMERTQEIVEQLKTEVLQKSGDGSESSTASAIKT